jgi:hypothetical protein
MDLGHWINSTGLDEIDLESSLGFIYRITLQDEKKSYYIGRKQFWNKRGRYWYDSEWRTYTSSSTRVNEYVESNGISALRFEILAVFSSKSLLNYAETLGIILSRSYEDSDRGLNGQFSRCRGTLKFEGTDGEQLAHLRKLLLAEIN